MPAICIPRSQSSLRSWLPEHCIRTGQYLDTQQNLRRILKKCSLLAGKPGGSRVQSQREDALEEHSRAYASVLNASSPKLTVTGDTDRIGALGPAADAKTPPPGATDEGVFSIQDFTDPGGKLKPVAKKTQSAVMRVCSPQEHGLHPSETWRQFPTGLSRRILHQRGQEPVRAMVRFHRLSRGRENPSCRRRRQVRVVTVCW